MRRFLPLPLLAVLAACNSGPVQPQPQPGYCPPPYRVGAGGVCENDRQDND